MSERERVTTVEEVLAMNRMALGLQEQILRIAPDVELRIEVHRKPAEAGPGSGVAVCIHLDVVGEDETHAGAFEKVQAVLGRLFKEPQK